MTDMSSIGTDHWLILTCAEHIHIIILLPFLFLIPSQCYVVWLDYVVDECSIIQRFNDVEDITRPNGAAIMTESTSSAHKAHSIQSIA
jgi:hypothetical protein